MPAARPALQIPLDLSHLNYIAPANSTAPLPKRAIVSLRGIDGVNDEARGGARSSVRHIFLTRPTYCHPYCYIAAFDAPTNSFGD